ncbi:hypothetical protein B0919_19755 [Hymenobacter sp. CRA2]|nr:hypothetical protein B0919_19755 [Hymenobacter sp. CRA2]
MLSLAVFLTACAPGPGTTQRIGFSQSVGQDGWRQAMLAGIKRELTFHPEIQLLLRDAQGSSQQQQQHIQELLQAGVDVLIVAPSEEAALAPALTEAHRRGIPVILLDHRTSTVPYTAYVGGDNTTVGASAARYAAQLLHQRGQVVEIVGSSPSPVSEERHQGFVQALRAYPGMQVVGQVTGDWQPYSLQPDLTALLQAHPQAQLIFAHSDLMAQGASEVCRRLGMTHVRIIGVDGLAGPGNGMEMVQQGRSTASLFYPPGGEEAVRVALKLLRHQPFERENILGSIVIDSTNVLTMLQQEAKLASQQQGIEQQQLLLGTLQATYASQRTVLYGLLATLLAAIVLGVSAWRAARANRQTNRQLSRQNEEIRAQRNQIAAMAEQAQAQNEAKLRFFTNFSHELRTPLTLILGPVEELLRPDTSAALLPAQRHDLGLVRRNTQRLLQLVNQLLDFRKMQGGKMAVQAHPDDFVAFVRELVETFEPAARVQHLTLSFEPTEPTLPGWFDRNVLDKVFLNLLSNALKYTPAGGRISVAMQALDHGRVQVQVTDTGCGIRAQDSPHIFEWFYQGEQATGAKGSGMGLALAQGLVRLHQGELSCTSLPGQGSTFTVVLPRELPAVLRSTAAPIVTIERPALEEPVLPSAEADSAEASEATPLVVVIEDNPDVNDFVARKLRPHYRVRTAADGAAGLQLATELLPDLIVCDVMMPGLSGLEVVSRLRADWRTSHIPVILLTARIAPEQQVEGVQVGADLYLTKPFSPALLLESVRTLLANRAYQREHTRRQLLADQPVGEAPAHDPNQQFITDLTDIIEAHLTQTSLTVEEVAQQLHLTRTQLYRKVKAVLGTSVTDYLQHVRLRKARELLLNTPLTVTAVAYEVGYTSHSYFSSSFKARYQVSPSEFRAQCLASSA